MPDVYHVEDVILSVQLVLVLLCKIFSIKENQNVGERRRVWASCQVDGFTDIAGGHSFRNSKVDRLRFKAMHKIYDFNKRFGYQMCVGCGRCDDNCPQYISFSTTIDKINEFLKEDE